MSLRYSTLFASVPLLFSFVALRAHADIITYGFKATVNTITVSNGHQADWDNSVQLNDVFQGIYQVDTSSGSIGTTSALFTSPAGTYGFSPLQLGSYGFGPGTVYNSHTTVLHNQENSNHDSLRLDGSFTPQKTALGDQAIAYITGGGSNLFSSAAPPTSLSVLNALNPSLGFLQGHGNLGPDFFSIPSNNLFIGAQVQFTSVNVSAVPEPKVSVDLALGLAMLAACSLRRRKQPITPGR